MRAQARLWLETHYAPFGGLLHAARTGEVAATSFLGQPFFDWDHLLRDVAKAGAWPPARREIGRDTER